MYSCNASQHVHPYLYMHLYNIYSIFSYASPQGIITRFIKSLHAYPLNATLYGFIILCIQPYYGLTTTTSYSMHYYNQDHQSSLFLVIKFISTFTGHDIFLYECSINFFKQPHGMRLLSFPTPYRATLWKYAIHMNAFHS